jgi:hypothetical protein
MQTGSGCIARTVSYGGGDSSDQNNQAHLQAYELVTPAHSTQQVNIYSPFDGDRAKSNPLSLPAPLSHSPHRSGFRRKLYTPQEVARIQDCYNASRWRNPPVTVRRVVANLSTELGRPAAAIKKKLKHLGLAGDNVTVGMVGHSPLAIVLPSASMVEARQQAAVALQNSPTRWYLLVNEWCNPSRNWLHGFIRAVGEAVRDGHMETETAAQLISQRTGRSAEASTKLLQDLARKRERRSALQALINK